MNRAMAAAAALLLAGCGAPAPAPVPTVDCTGQWVLEQQLEAAIDGAYGRGDIVMWRTLRVERARLVGYGPEQCWDESLRAAMRAEASDIR